LHRNPPQSEENFLREIIWCSPAQKKGKSDSIQSEYGQSTSTEKNALKPEQKSSVKHANCQPKVSSLPPFHEHPTSCPQQGEIFAIVSRGSNIKFCFENISDHPKNTEPSQKAGMVNDFVMLPMRRNICPYKIGLGERRLFTKSALLSLGRDNTKGDTECIENILRIRTASD